jgi:hypothetical protein
MYFSRWFCVLEKSNRVIPAYEDENTHQGIPWNLDNDIGENKDLPGIGL